MHSAVSAPGKSRGVQSSQFGEDCDDCRACVQELMWTGFPTEDPDVLDVSDS